MTKEDLDTVRGRARVIAINDTWRLAPWADVLYASDWRWWRKYNGVPGFAGIKVGISNSRGQLDEWPDINLIENTGPEGLETEPSGVRTGRNGGYQAINLAVHLGAKRIVLLGYDMKAAPDGRTHFFGDHEDWPTSAAIFADSFLPHFVPLKAELDKIGVEVVNATPGSALTVFPMTTLEKALADRL